MKNLFRNIFLVSCLLLTVGAVEAQAQTAQKQTDPRIQTEMAELQAKLQKLTPGSNDYKGTKAAYDELLAKANKKQTNAAKPQPHRAMAVRQAPKASTATVAKPAPKNDTYAKLQAYQKANPINEPNKRIKHIRTMEQQRDFYLQNGDAATAAKVNNDIANFKAEARKSCPNCWMGEGEKPVGQ